MNKYSLSALAAAGLLAGGLATGANAADLGGNCCADLEERVAELEATTARKGNRKVSLTISGWVAEQVTWWDDGVESNAYVTGLGTTLGTNVKFTGQAQIMPGWTAGYVLHLEADGSDSLTTNQTRDNGPGLFAGSQNYVQTLQSFWFLKSEHLGKVSVGLQSMPSDNAAILVDGSGTLVPANWVAFDVLGFGIRRNDGSFAGGPAASGAFGFNWGAAGACIPGDCYGVPFNSVRYDSPTFAGFSGSAGWGEDDVWDLALRYAGEMHGFKLAATITYGESTDTGDPTNLGAGSVGTTLGNSQYTQVGAYIQHIGTGLFGLVNYGNFEVDADTVGTGDTWYFKAGIRGKWTHLGATIPYGEYMTSESSNSQFVGGDTSTAKGQDAEFKWWGLGVVQEIDAAAMSMWIKYRQFEFDQGSGSTICSAGGGCQDLDEVTFGALINF